jgi:hypothetical protein
MGMPSKSKPRHLNDSSHTPEHTRKLLVCSSPPPLLGSLGPDDSYLAGSLPSILAGAPAIYSAGYDVALLHGQLVVFWLASACDLHTHQKAAPSAS